METIEQITLGEKIIGGLRKAADELEKFRLQASLGKAEARDAYEEAKIIFKKYLNEAALRLGDAKNIATESSLRLKTLLETLQVQLALGKAETKDAFEEQRKKITKALNELEEIIKKNKTADEYYTKLLLEAGKFKIKLDILKLQYQLKKLKARIDIDEKKKDFTKRLSDIKKRLSKKEEETENTWGHFRDEISDAYSHLKKAFVR